MAELADALASGASSRKGVEVRVLFRAPRISSLPDSISQLIKMGHAGTPSCGMVSNTIGKVSFYVSSCFLCRLSKRAHRIFNTLEPTTFLQSNDRFAFDLPEVSHVSGKEANVVLAPLPVSLSFAALWSNGSTAQGSKELMAAFHWEKWLWQCKRKQNAAGEV